MKPWDKHCPCCKILLMTTYRMCLAKNILLYCHEVVTGPPPFFGPQCPSVLSGQWNNLLVSFVSEEKRKNKEKKIKRTQKLSLEKRTWSQVQLPQPHLHWKCNSKAMWFHLMISSLMFSGRTNSSRAYFSRVRLYKRYPTKVLSFPVSWEETWQTN